MPRYLVQSLDTGRFLIPTESGPDWTRDLRNAGGGVISDESVALEMAIDYAEVGERVQVVDLDRLGTAGDYE